MDGAESPVTDERGDDPFDVPPMAKMSDVADVSGGICSRRGLDGRFVAITLDELRCVGQGTAAMNEGNVHSPRIARHPFRDCRRASSTRR